MNCFNCGCKLSKKEFCTNCGADVFLYKKIMAASNLFYNQGLEKAKVRDLSGAIVSLRQSLKFDKNNIQARNLLGLVYFEVGSITEAVQEWVISKNIKSEKNIADDYMSALQKSPTRFDDVSQTIKKYNIALGYCYQDAIDMAVIQLRKVLVVNSKFVPARQLLALIYMREEKYNEAIIQLQKCLQVDINNTRALNYLSEINKILDKSTEGEEKKKRARKSKSSEVVQYVSGNETIIRQVVDRDVFNIHSVINILIGIALGVAITCFLVVPMWVDMAVDESNNQISSLNTEVVKKSSAIQELERELDDANDEIELLETQVEQSLGEKDRIEYYNSLLSVIDMYLNKNADYEAMVLELDKIEAGFLETEASQQYKDVFGTLIGKTGNRIADIYYKAGYKAYESAKYEEAILNFEKAYFYDENEDDAIYNLANAYRKAGMDSEATAAYNDLIVNFPNTENAKHARVYLDEIENGTD